MHRLAAGLLSFATGNQLTVNHYHCSITKQNLYENLVKMYQLLFYLFW